MKKYTLLLLGFLANIALASWPHEHISSAVFAKSVENRMPIEIITEADNTLGKVYFFTNIRHLTGDKITHRWIYTPTGESKGKVKAQISFNIKGKRWRVWSSKNIWHTWTGKWTVEVLNQKNQILLSKTLIYNKKYEQSKHK